MSEFVCDQGLRTLVAERLRAFDTHREVMVGKGSAVALTITDAGHGGNVPGLADHTNWSNEAALIMTRRATGLRSHAGQWAFPGGRMDAGETPEETALREMREEIHLDLGLTRLLGRLDDFETRSGYVMTPVVFWAGPQRAMQANPNEVASIHRIPLAELMREDAPLLTQIPESTHPVLRMPIGESWIAAPTAALLYQFREVCLLGRETRVSHFEQPYFAWR